MVRKVCVVGKTVEFAVADALAQLGVGRDRAEVVVKTAPSRGFFGFGARGAEVEVAVVEDPVGDAERFLREMFVTMGIAVRLSCALQGDDVTFSLEGDRVGLLIGKHGQTLDAIQVLVNAVGNKYSSRHVQFFVDAEGYRERRRQALIAMAQRMAEKAVALRREIALQPMSAHERKIVHTALDSCAGVRTESRGHDPDRAIVIVPDDALRKTGRVKPGSRAGSAARGKRADADLKQGSFGGVESSAQS